MNIGLFAIFAAVLKINSADEHGRFVRQALTSVYCRKNADTCLQTFCQRLEYSRSCSDIHIKAEMQFRLAKCREPKPEECLQNLPVPEISIFADNRALTPENCRRDPNMCVDVLCRRPQYSVDCMDGNVKSEMIRRLGKCREPNVEDCIRNLPLPARNENPLSSNNRMYCSAQMSYCSTLACNTLVINQHHETCSSPHVKRRLEDHLRGCKVPDLDVCIDKFVEGSRNIARNPVLDYSSVDFNQCSMDNMGTCMPGIDSSSSNWQDISKFCRENLDTCLPVACKIFESLFGMSCSDYTVKNTLRTRLQRCYSTVLGCITILPMRTTRSLNPSTCKSNVESCLAVACNANKEGLTKGCEDWYIKKEIEHKLKTCNNYFQCFREKVMPLKSCDGWCPSGYQCKFSKCFPVVRKDPTRCNHNNDCAHSSLYSCSGGQCRLIGV